MKIQLGPLLSDKQRFRIRTSVSEMQREFPSRYSDEEVDIEGLVREKHMCAFSRFMDNQKDRFAIQEPSFIREFSTDLIVLTPKELRDILTSFYEIGKKERKDIEGEIVV